MKKQMIALATLMLLTGSALADGATRVHAKKSVRAYYVPHTSRSVVVKERNTRAAVPKTPYDNSTARAATPTYFYNYGYPYYPYAQSPALLPPPGPTGTGTMQMSR